MQSVLIVGANGFIATQFMAKYHDKYKFVCVSHKGNLTLEDLEKSSDIIHDIDIVLNLAGSNIGAKRWSIKRKDELLSSRIITTDRLIRLFNQYNPHAHIVNASAIGIYDVDTLSNELTTIEYNCHLNFSMQLVKQWEQSASKYKGDLTITRFGVVLSHQGGAFPKMLKPFLFGLGGKLGDGAQYFPWISLTDLLNILDILITKRNLGIYNLVAPQMITNLDLTHAISQIWQRPQLLNMPKWLIKLLFGQMGEELFLNSIKVESVKLKELEYQFTHPNINQCLIAIKKGDV